MTPFFSIIMPTYNRAKLIGGAIESVLAQNFSSWELIIIDDGSRDRTVKLIKTKYSNYLNKNIFLHQLPTNRGQCVARNLGLKHARGKWIAYHDSDDTWQPNFLSSFKQVITNHPQTHWFYCARRQLSGGQIIGKKIPTNMFLLDNHLALGTVVHRQKIIKQVGVFDPSLTQLEDWDFAIRLAAHSPPHYLPLPLYNYNDSQKYKHVSSYSINNYHLNCQKIIIKHLSSLTPKNFYQIYSTVFSSFLNPKSEISRLTSNNQHLVAEQAAFAKSIWYKIWWHTHRH